MTEKMPSGTHPNSLKNLKPGWTSETAKDAQLLGAAKRKANRMAREQLKMSIESWRGLQEELKDDNVSSVDMLKVMMMQKLDEGDHDTAIDIMKTLAEFERPKLARIESKVEEVKTDALSDEELDARLSALMAKK